MNIGEKTFLVVFIFLLVIQANSEDVNIFRVIVMLLCGILFCIYPNKMGFKE